MKALQYIFRVIPWWQRLILFFSGNEEEMKEEQTLGRKEEKARPAEETKQKIQHQ